MTVAEMPFRFLDKVLIGDGCWEWQGSRPDGHYGLFSFGRKRVGAHRVAYSLWYGAIPAALWVLHRCDNKGCVRPDHLFLGTPMDNMDDMEDKGRRVLGGFALQEKTQTQCDQGHLFDDENTYWTPYGARRCRACQAAAGRRYRARRRSGS